MKKTEPEQGELVMQHLATCELIGKKAIYIKLEVYPLCMEGEFAKYYEEYMAKLKYEMGQEGYTWNEEEQRFEAHEELESYTHTEETRLDKL